VTCWNPCPDCSSRLLARLDGFLDVGDLDCFASTGALYEFFAGGG